ncbi:MAG: DUF951 domain-containing protein [Anaerolineae bacterium]|nr:DUF951 domain-containing protein [Thermoflexales bacterium]MDW8407511.1 DUF951 domain-containing protein [Anaerolineae bacterium]
MSPTEPTPLELDDVVKLRKPHPCGGYEWRVIRVGADIGLRCLTCGRKALLSRRELQRRLVERRAGRLSSVTRPADSTQIASLG